MKKLITVTAIGFALVGCGGGDGESSSSLPLTPDVEVYEYHKLGPVQHDLETQIAFEVNVTSAESIAMEGMSVSYNQQTGVVETSITGVRNLEVVFSHPSRTLDVEICNELLEKLASEAPCLVKVTSPDNEVELIGVKAWDANYNEFSLSYQ